MNYKFSKNAAALQGSAIREILKATSDPGVISFAAGSPASEALPAAKLREISDRILSDEPLLALSYNITEGYTPLREKVKERLLSMNCFNPETDDVIITSGAQQGIELVCKVLCDSSDTLLCEAPSFIGSLNSFRSYGVNIEGITLENDGIDISELEEKVKGQNVKLLYIIPNFQNPTGITTSYEKRKQIYELSQKYGFVILEDNPYGDLRFEGEDAASIKTMDKDGHVVYAGTFSKILAPGLRVGYLSGPREILQKCTVCKQTADVHTNIWAQLICYNFLNETDLDAHLKSVREIYKRKCGLMLNEMEKNFADSVSFTKPQGGMFIWASLPEKANMKEFCSEAAFKYKVAVVPGDTFSVNGEKYNSFRLNFSTPCDEDIIKGIEILGKMTNNL